METRYLYYLIQNTIAVLGVDSVRIGYTSKILQTGVLGIERKDYQICGIKIQYERRTSVEKISRLRGLTP